MVLDRSGVQKAYRRIAPFYDALLWMYRPFGLRRRRRMAVRVLGLRPGDTVVDLGCGTGLNLPLLQEAVGPAGRVIGVDLTDAMLRAARRRMTGSRSRNVELVRADITEYELPSRVDGVLTTFALEMVPEYDAVVRRVAAALRPHGRLAVLGLKEPERWPEWLIRLAVLLNRPFGLSRDYAALKPWLAVRRHMEEVDHREFLLGAMYLSVGQPHAR